MPILSATLCIRIVSMLFLIALLLSVTPMTLQQSGMANSTQCVKCNTPSCKCYLSSSGMFGSDCKSLLDGNVTKGNVSCVSPGQFYLKESLKNSFFMVTGCPSDVDVSISSYCDNYSNTSNGASFYQLPVFGRISHILYGNFYCAICNGEVDVVYWDVMRTCTSNYNMKGYCSLTFQPTSVNNTLIVYSQWIAYTTLAPSRPNMCYSEHMDVSIRPGTAGGIRCEPETAVEAGRPGVAGGAGAVPSLSILFNFNDKTNNGNSRFNCASGQFWDPFRGICVVTLASIPIEMRPQNITKPPMLNCSFISYIKSEYVVDSNGTVSILSRPGSQYLTDEYFISNSVLFVCNPFNLTKPDTSLPNSVDAQNIITLVGVILSLILLLVLFVVYSVFPVLRNIPGKCVMSLTVSLFVGEFLLMFSSNWANASHVICVIQSVLMHYSWLVAFLWMNVLSFDVFRSLSNMSATASSSRDNKTSRYCPPGRFIKYSLYAWTLPALLVSASLIFDLRGDQQSAYRPRYGGSDGTSSIGDNQVCWFNSPRGLLVFFAAPVGLLLVVNIILFIATVFHICRTTKASKPAVKSSNNGQLLVICVKLFVVMGLPWILGFVATLTQWTALWYLYAIFNSLQGALIAVSFLSSRQVRKLLRQLLVDKGCCHSGSPAINSQSDKTTISAATI